MTTTILIGLIALSSFLAIKWKIQNNILMDECADCFKRLDESAKNTYKSEYVHELQKKLEHYENYFKNHHCTDL